MRIIKWITLGGPLVVCLCGLSAGPSPPQQCDTLDSKPNCDTYDVTTGTCWAKASCLDDALSPCGLQTVSASVSVPQGDTCEVGTGYVDECGEHCGGYAWAEALNKQHQVVSGYYDYCCAGCY